MMDVWTKKGPDGKTITFKEESVEGMGFMYFAEGRITTETWTTQEEHTREQVEEHFGNYVNGPKSESKFHVVQSQHGIRNDLGEMTETALHAHLHVRLGYDMNPANDFMSLLEKSASVTLYSEDGQIRLEVQRIATAAP